MADPTPQSTDDLAVTGRRRAKEQARRLPSPLVIAAVVIPLLTVAALALVRPTPDPVETRAPQEATLSRSTLVCAPALSPQDRVVVGLADTVEDGEVVLRVRGDDTTVPVEDAPVSQRSRPATTVIADGEVAPGVVATRAGTGRVSACSQPAPETWFTGVGAGPEHASTLVLVNPDRGPAVADVFVLGPDGLREVPALRGIRVGGGRTTELDLSKVVPTQDPLAVRVVVSRGRLGGHVVDRLDPLGRARASRQWLPGQGEARETSWVLGLGTTPTDRTLTVANPTADTARVELRLVTQRSEFATQGLPEIEVAAESVVEVDVSRVLRSRAAKGALGLRLDATGPVTASLRSASDGQLSHAVAGEPVTERAVTTLPVGAKQLVVGGISDPGILTWRVRGVDGAWSEPERLEVDPGTAQRIPLPRGGTLLEVVVDRAELVAAVELGPPGLAVLPLRDQVTSSLVPDVRPGVR